jgi:hypothetical protein
VLFERDAIIGSSRWSAPCAPHPWQHVAAFDIAGLFQPLVKGGGRDRRAPCRDLYASRCHAAINSRACPAAAFFREMSNSAQTQPSHRNLLPEGRLLLRSRRYIDSPRHWWKPTIKSSSSRSTASSQGVRYGYPDTSDHYRHCAAARRRRLVWPRTLVLGPVYIHLVPRTVATRLMMAANP